MPSRPPDPKHVVVVGAGIAGLSAAMHLRARGCEVTVLEGEPDVGGVCHELVIDGVHHDSGPTVLTMPNLLGAAFSALGADMNEHLQLTRLDPAYRATYHDGSHIDVGDSIDKTAASVEGACGAAEADRFREFAAHCTRLYETSTTPRRWSGRRWWR